MTRKNTRWFLLIDYELWQTCFIDSKYIAEKKKILEFIYYSFNAF